MNLNLNIDIGVGRTPGYATVHRFLHDQRPYGAPDKTGLYRITGHGDRKLIRDPYKPVEKITSADTCRRGQKSIDCFFTSATHALAPDVKEGEQIQIIGRTIKFRESKSLIISLFSTDSFSKELFKFRALSMTSLSDVSSQTASLIGRSFYTALLTLAPLRGRVKISKKFLLKPL